MDFMGSLRVLDGFSLFALAQRESEPISLGGCRSPCPGRAGPHSTTPKPRSSLRADHDAPLEEIGRRHLKRKCDPRGASSTFSVLKSAMFCSYSSDCFRKRLKPTLLLVA